jgi:hypothetical protein
LLNPHYCVFKSIIGTQNWKCPETKTKKKGKGNGTPSQHHGISGMTKFMKLMATLWNLSLSIFIEHINVSFFIKHNNY